MVLAGRRSLDVPASKVWSFGLGRLRPGASVESANREIRSLLTAREPGESVAAGSLTLEGLGEEMIAPIRLPLQLLLVSSVVLLITILASAEAVLVARVLSRRNELTIHSALGASPQRVLSTTWVGGVVMGVAGTVIGALVVPLLLRVMSRSLLWALPRADQIEAGGQFAVLLVAFGGAAAALLAVPPAVMASRLAARSVTHAAESPRLRGVLGSARLVFVAHLMMATILLVACGLLVKSVWLVSSVELGFEPSDRVLAELQLGDAHYGIDGARRKFLRDLLGALEREAWVECAAVGTSLPLSDGLPGLHVSIDDPDGAGALSKFVGNATWVSEGYAEALGMGLVEGRWLRESDGGSAEMAAVVNVSFARAHDLSLDQTLLLTTGAFRVVGITADSRVAGPESEPRPEAFFAFDNEQSQAPPRRVGLIVASRLPADEVSASLRRVLNRLDPALATSRIESLSIRLSSLTARRRIIATIISAYTVVSALLALLSGYAVFVVSVVAREREVAIRRSLGATPLKAFSGVVRAELIAGGWAVLLGSLLAVPIARAVRSLLFGLSPYDPAVWLLAVGGVATCIAVGCAPSFLRSLRTEDASLLR